MRSGIDTPCVPLATMARMTVGAELRREQRLRTTRSHLLLESTVLVGGRAVIVEVLLVGHRRRAGGLAGRVALLKVSVGESLLQVLHLGLKSEAYLGLGVLGGEAQRVK